MVFLYISISLLLLHLIRILIIPTFYLGKILETIMFQQI